MIHHVGASISIYTLTLPHLFSCTIKEKEVNHMLNWSYDLIKLIYEEKLKDLLIDDEIEKSQM